MLVITHYQRLLDYIVPDFVHVLARRQDRARSGGKELALELEEKGYGWLEVEPGAHSAGAELMNALAPPAIATSRASKTSGATEPACRMARLRATRSASSAASAFPTRRLEEWRYTNVRRSRRSPSRLPSGDGARVTAIERTDLDPWRFPLFACSLFVFVDGRFAPELSAPGAPVSDGTVESLAALRTRRARSASSLTWYMALRRDQGAPLRGAEHGRLRWTTARCVHRVPAACGSSAADPRGLPLDGGRRPHSSTHPRVLDRRREQPGVASP